MTDAEIRQEAKLFLLDAWDEQIPYADPENFVMRETPGGEIEFCLRLNEAGLGRAEITYSPQPFIEKLIREGDAELTAIESEGYLAELEAADQYYERLVALTASIIVRNLKHEAIHFVSEQGPQALCIFLEGTEHVPASKAFLPNVRSALESAKDQRKRKLSFFKAEVEHMDVAPQELFDHFFKHQKLLWDGAKKCYKANKRLANVLDIVKLAFPTLPSEMVDLLAEPKGTENTPEVLALQSTAYITNLPKSVRAKRTLQEYRKKSIEMRKEIPDEEFHTMLLCFSAYKLNRLKDAWVLEELKKASGADTPGS